LHFHHSQRLSCLLQRLIGRVAFFSAGDAMITLGGPSAPSVALSTSFFRQRYLFAFASQPEVRQYLRTQLVRDEAARTPEILQAWADAQPKIQQLMSAEANLAEQIRSAAISPPLSDQIDAMLNNDLVRNAFQLQTSVAEIEIDKLIAAQRTVNLEYVDKLLADLPDPLTEDAVARLCLSSERTMSPIQHLELAPNAHAFSSPSSDLRFLGSYLKDNLSVSDLAYAHGGGVPAAAIIILLATGRTR
jgi:hypothetical protein